MCAILSGDEKLSVLMWKKGHVKLGRGARGGRGGNVVSQHLPGIINAFLFGCPRSIFNKPLARSGRVVYSEFPQNEQDHLTCLPEEKRSLVD